MIITNDNQTNLGLSKHETKINIGMVGRAVAVVKGWIFINIGVLARQLLDYCYYSRYFFLIFLLISHSENQTRPMGLINRLILGPLLIFTPTTPFSVLAAQQQPTTSINEYPEPTTIINEYPKLTKSINEYPKPSPDPILYDRPSLQDKNGEYAIVVQYIQYTSNSSHPTFSHPPFHQSPDTDRIDAIWPQPGNAIRPFLPFTFYFPFSLFSNTSVDHQLSPRGCSAFLYNNGPDSYRYVCWDADAKIFPDYDSFYRITLFTGFPGASRRAYVHPKYKHDYAWKFHRKVYINGEGCLRPCE